MLSLFFSLSLLAPICIYTILQFRSLKHNIASAKASGLPYVIVPFSIASPLTALLQASLKWVPEEWKGRWLSIFTALEFTRGWHNSSRPFSLMRSSTFLAISPSTVILYTYDPDVSAHFLRGPAFGKPHELLGILNIYGPTMTGTDGAETRLYRRTTAPFFNDRTMRRVWRVASRGAQVLTGVLGEDAEGEEKAKIGGNGKDAKYFMERMRAVVARLTLHVVATVCFQREDQKWGAVSLREALRGEDTFPKERQLSFSKAMHGVLEWFGVIFLTPRVLLDYSPLRMHREAGLAYRELGHYMQDLKAKGEKEIQEHKKKAANKESSNLLDLLVSAGLDSTTQTLTPSEVLGNIFIFLFAGHEANANTLTFLFYLLACNPDAQRRAQRDITKILPQLQQSQNRGDYLEEGSLYDSAYPALMESFVGACINEALRLYTVLPYLVKTVPTQPSRGQASDRDGYIFSVNGTPHHIPGGTMVLVNTTAAHTNPEYWPEPGKAAGSGSYKSATRTSPVDLFNPDLWFPSNDIAEEKDSAHRDSAHFLRPKAGTFIPFSDGSRGCLGKRFALVELCAIVTRVLAEYSVELVVKDGDEWQSARDEAARVLLEEVEFHMSLRVTGKVPVRFVRRGEETLLEI